MATLDYDEIKPKRYIIQDGVPYEILESHVARTQKRKPQNQVRMRNLLNGKVIPGTFHASDTAEEADVRRGEAKYLYSSKGEFWFCLPNDPSKRFMIDADIIGDYGKYLKGNEIVDTLIFEYEEEEKIIGIKLPIKMTFLVKEAPPAIKGNTASGGNKQITLETGAVVNAPLFIEAGETIVVNTETGEYVERVK